MSDIENLEFAVRNKMDELYKAINDGSLWVVIQKCKEAERALMELRLKAIKLGFESTPQRLA